MGNFIEWMDAHLRAHGVKYLGGLIVAALFGSWATGFASKVFDGRVARIVVSQVAEQVSPIQQRVNAIEHKVDATRADVTALLRQSYVREIVEVKTLLCANPGDRRLLNSLEEAQDKFAKLNDGDRYVPPDCNILTKRG